MAEDNSVEGDGIVVDGVNINALEYLYGPDGVTGLYDGAKHYFRRNVQGDITRIYAIAGTFCGMLTNPHP